MKKREVNFKIIIAICIFFLISGLIYYWWKNYLDEDALVEWLRDNGLITRIVYILLAAVQVVVAVIPAGPLELLGGYAFGTFQAVGFYLLGTFLGSCIVFLLVRKYGKSLVQIFVKEESIDKLESYFGTRKGMTIFALLFIIPGSPKDILCYMAGLSKIKLTLFLVVASFGRIPAVLGTAFSASAVEKSDYSAAIIVGVITFLVCVAGGIVYRWILQKSEKDN